MNSKSTRARTADDDAPTRARPRRGKDGNAGDQVADKILDKTRAKARDRTHVKTGGKAGDTLGETTGDKIAPSMIHTVAHDVLLPYQVRWIADDSAVKVAEKSRRVGITWAEAADAALSAAAMTGMDTWYLGYNRDMAREFVETAAAWARQFNKAAQAIEEIALEDERRDLLAYRIRFASGHKIVALSSRPSNLRGKQGRAVIDEAAFHDDLPELLKAAMAFTMWGGLVRVISTHNGAENPFNELINDIHAGRRPFSLHRVTLDDALAEGLYHRMCQKAGRRYSAAAEREWRARIFAEYGDAAGEELLCVPRASAGAFLSSMLVESRMRAGAPVLRWEVAEEFSERPEEYRAGAAREWCERNLDPALERLANLMSCFGEDFGRNGDLSVFWPLQIQPNLVRRTPFVVELRRVPFRQQEQILFYIVDRLPRLIGGALDARGNGQYLAEIARQRYGARVEQVMLSAQWYRDNMPRYKAAFEDGMVELPRDAEILADHRALEIEHGYAHVAERRDRKGRHGDAAIAGALAYYASSIRAQEPAYTAAPRRAAAMKSSPGERDPFGPPGEDAAPPLAVRGGRARAWAWM
jgi:phage FluMu gp28-like protein